MSISEFCKHKIEPLLLLERLVCLLHSKVVSAITNDDSNFNIFGRNVNISMQLSVTIGFLSTGKLSLLYL